MYCTVLYVHSAQYVPSFLPLCSVTGEAANVVCFLCKKAGDPDPPAVFWFLTKKPGDRGWWYGALIRAKLVEYEMEEECM
jgi:hypothetical protein